MNTTQDNLISSTGRPRPIKSIGDLSDGSQQTNSVSGTKTVDGSAPGVLTRAAQNHIATVGQAATAMQQAPSGESFSWAAMPQMTLGEAFAQRRPPPATELSSLPAPAQPQQTIGSTLNRPTQVPASNTPKASTIYGKDLSFGDQPIDGGKQYVPGTSDVGKPGGSLTVVPAAQFTAGPTIGDMARYSENSNLARAQQTQDLAASTAAESQIAARNELQDQARNARIDAGSLRLTPGARTQRQLLANADDLAARAGHIQELPPNKDFITSPEQQANIDTQRQNANTEAFKAQSQQNADPLTAAINGEKLTGLRLGNAQALRDLTTPAGTPGAPKLTEQQSKDLGFYTRGISALKNLGNGSALSTYGSTLASGLPLVGNAAAGKDYQLQDQAGREFINAILRKDSGAALTASEMDNYGKTFLPKPGDSKETIAQKANARQTALEAIKLGMGPAQQLVPQQPQDAKDYSHLWK